MTNRRCAAYIALRSNKAKRLDRITQCSVQVLKHAKDDDNTSAELSRISTTVRQHGEQMAQLLSGMDKVGDRIGNLEKLLTAASPSHIPKYLGDNISCHLKRN